MRPPGFWAHGGNPLWPALLSPLEAVTRRATARRVARPGWQAPVPVICVGNATSGGAGKTTVALDLGARLAAQGRAVHFLTRGHGGRVPGPHRVMEADRADVGDEARLLAQLAPTWVAADRAAAARLAVAAGADVLVMDDGLQNPTLAGKRGLLVIDGPAGFGNGHLLPAGPLREPVAAAAARCRAALLIGPDATGALAALPPGLPVLRATLQPGAEAAAFGGQRVLAFAGIARPSKFYATLRQAGAELAACQDFPDHHPFTPAELSALLARADALGAVPVTTPKDAVRLPPGLRPRIRVLGVRLHWAPGDAEAVLESLLHG